MDIFEMSVAWVYLLDRHSLLGPKEKSFQFRPWQAEDIIIIWTAITSQHHHVWGCSLSASLPHATSSPTMGLIWFLFFYYYYFFEQQFENHGPWGSGEQQKELMNALGENLKQAHGKPWLVLRVANHSQIQNNQMH